jgi:1,2-diacylglycerol 3-alpha-glucosyltransferase
LFKAVLLGLEKIARRVIIEKADVVVSPTITAQEYVKSRHRVSHTPIIPYGIEILQPRPKDVRLLKQQFGLCDGPVILSLGHVNLYRDRLDLIQAMPLVLEHFPTTRLLIVGEVYVQEPVQLVQKLGLENHITFTGAVPHDQIPALFELSDVEAHTANTDYPGPGIASMEAMATGLPVITTEVASSSSFNLENWRNIVMVPLNKPNIMAEALLRLLSDEQLRRHIGENARKMIAQHYSWDAVCESYISLYRDTIERYRKRATSGT